MLFRFQRGSLEDSMNTVREVNSLAEIEALLRSAGIPSGKLKVYDYGYDSRVGWNTHVVTVNGKHVGFTNGRMG